jgi:hypothetical protein
LLLLKQAIKRGPGVAGVARSLDVARMNRRLGGDGGWWRSGIPRNRHARFEERALVSPILHGDPYRHWLQALKARRWLKIRTLLAAMQGRMALGAVALKIHIWSKRSRTVIAARCGGGLDQAWKARAGYVDRGPRPLRTRSISGTVITAVVTE